MLIADSQTRPTSRDPGHSGSSLSHASPYLVLNATETITPVSFVKRFIF